MIQISATEFKTNFGKYLSIAAKEEIHIMKNGRNIAVLVPPPEQPSVIDELVGVIPDDGYSVKQARSERRYRHENND